MAWGGDIIKYIALNNLSPSVYDVTSRSSFEALNGWFTELETFSTSPDVIKCIVGNKVDKDLSRVVTTDEGQAFADNKGAIFVEASAKQGVGVQGAFDELVNRVGKGALRRYESVLIIHSSTTSDHLDTLPVAIDDVHTARRSYARWGTRCSCCRLDDGQRQPCVGIRGC